MLSYSKFLNKLADYGILLEGILSAKTLVSVDIQPEYSKNFGFSIDEYTQFLNENYEDLHQLIFLYNGPDLGFPSEEEYKYYLLENGLSEDIVDQSKFYEKNYAFFRNAMDQGIDEDILAGFIRFLYSNNINDSRDMGREMWTKYLREYRRTDRREVLALYKLLYENDDMVNIPDLMEYIRPFNNIVLVGGGRNECLKEVEIAFKALNKPYTLFRKFVY